MTSVTGRVSDPELPPDMSGFNMETIREGWPPRKQRSDVITPKQGDVACRSCDSDSSGSAGRSRGDTR